MDVLTEEKDNSLTIDQTYGGLLYADINNPSNIGSTMNEEFINIQSSQTVSFLDKNIGALICNDIGNRNYDNIYAEAMDEYKRTHAGSFNPEDIVFHNMMTEKLLRIKMIYPIA